MDTTSALLAVLFTFACVKGNYTDCADSDYMTELDGFPYADDGRGRPGWKDDARECYGLNRDRPSRGSDRLWDYGLSGPNRLGRGSNGRDGLYRIADALESCASDKKDPTALCRGSFAVIQRRSGGRISFDRDWQDYKWGFASEECEDFWVGLEYLHQVTKRRPYELRVTMIDKDGIRAKAIYDDFKVKSERKGYKLRLGRWLPVPRRNCTEISDIQRGKWDKRPRVCNAGDGLRGSDGLRFTTHDSDNDNWVKDNCAKTGKSGFWFGACFHSNPNGQYGNSYTAVGIIWDTFRPITQSLSFIEMAIRPTHRRP